MSTRGAAAHAWILYLTHLYTSVSVARLMNRSSRIRSSSPRAMNVVGLMSGTSADGIDAALVRIAGDGDAVTAKPLAFYAWPYPRGLQQRVLSAAAHGSVADICHLNTVLGNALGMPPWPSLRGQDCRQHKCTSSALMAKQCIICRFRFRNTASGVYAPRFKLPSLQ